MGKIKKNVGFKWSNGLAYCVGLLESDGNLSKDGRHIIFVSKDKDLVLTFRNCLDLKNKVCVKNSGFNKNGKYYYIQFGNVTFYRWLNALGMTSNKSKTIGSLKIPKKYFFSFLRGLLDGDGCVTGFKHPQSKYFQIRVKFASGSKKFLAWLKNRIEELVCIRGKIEDLPRLFELVYYKNASIKLLKKIYNKPEFFLKRKFARTKLLLAEG